MFSVIFFLSLIAIMVYAFGRLVSDTIDGPQEK